MVQSRAATVSQYLAELPPDRRAVVSAVRRVVRQNLPRGFREAINWGMISYEVPLTRCPKTYNGKPLAYAALASQKRYCSLYLMSIYIDTARRAQLRSAFRAAGCKLDMGKCCIRFTKASDLPLPAIGRLIAATTPSEFIAYYQSARSR